MTPRKKKPAAKRLSAERHDVNLDHWARELHDGDHPLIEAVRALRAENALLREAISKAVPLARSVVV